MALIKITGKSINVTGIFAERLSMRQMIVSPMHDVSDRPTDRPTNVAHAPWIDHAHA